MIMKNLVVIVLLVLLPILLQAQENDSTRFNFNAYYISDIGRNFTGGIKTDNFYIGLVNLSLNIKLFKNGEFFIQAQNTHGNTPSRDIVGDLQVFSNIENGNHTYLYSVLYKQTFRNLTATIGIHDLNSEFLNSECGGFFLNSSFGIQPNISWNMPVSIFPKNALGLVFKYQLTNNISIQNAIYDGNPGDLEDDKYNIEHSIKPKEEGILNVSEFKYHHFKSETRQSCFKLGAVYHSAKFIDYNDSTLKNGNFGLYFITEQMVNANNRIFAQIGWSPSNKNVNSYYGSLGYSFTNLGRKKENIAGLAVSYANYNKIYDNNSYNMGCYETALEAFYRFQINPYISLQPDVQYIINPGACSGLANAFVGFLRLTIGVF